MQYIKGHGLVFLFIAVVILLAAGYVWRVSDESAAQKMSESSAFQSLNTAAEQQSYTDLAGEAIGLEKYVGQVLVVNSWASWSPDSQQELPQLAELAQLYKDQSVQVIAINRAENKTTAERFLKVVGVNETLDLILDPDDRYYQSVAGYAMPQTIFYDKSGNIVYQHHGVMKKAVMKKYIDLALESSVEQ